MNSDRLQPLDELKKFTDRHKNLSRLGLSLSNYAFDADIFWCRFAHNEKWNIAMHSHSFFELHFCLSGFAKFSNEQGEVLSLRPGTFALFPVNQEHSLCFHSENFEKLVMGFQLGLKHSADYPFLEGAFRSVPFEEFEASDKMIQYASRIGDEVYNDRPAYKLILCNLLSNLIIEIARIITPNHSNQRGKYKKKDDRLDTLFVFMRDNLSRHLTSEDFAAEANMSVKQLNRLMQQTHHMSISDFFRKERIEKAKKLLAHTSYTTARIALEVGFSDEFSFGKAFKRTVGIAPGVFRSSFSFAQESNENT